MISQFFEIQVEDGRVNTYMDLAASLKPRLDAMGGCLFLDRYKSLKLRKGCGRTLYRIHRPRGSCMG